MWNTVKKKQSIIDTIINEKQINEEIAIEIMLNEIIDGYE